MCRSVKQKASCSCVLTCEPPGLGLCQMEQTRSRWRKPRSLIRRRAFMSSIKGVSHLSRRDKRRLYYKLLFWLWRKWRKWRKKWRKKRRFRKVRTRRRRCGSGVRTATDTELHLKSQKAVLLENDDNSEVKSPESIKTRLGPDAGGPGEVRQNWLGSWSQSESVSGLSDAGSVSQTSPTAASLADSVEPSGRPRGLLHPPEPSHTVPPLQGQAAPFRSLTGPLEHSPDLHHSGSEKTTSCLNEVNADTLNREIRDFLEVFFRRYGSFIPLHKSDVLRHLKRKFNSDFSDRKSSIFSKVDTYRTAIIQESDPSYRVVYKKHIVTLEDLLTLANEHWLNDQVMNMYGELIMESSNHKVHFLNSFFHRQLMTKGYDGVRRWTKQVDLFSKTLLLVPIHLEVHWCLVTADISAKKICLYDSQGHSLQKVARNILKYLLSEAKEKKQAYFQDGWTVSFVEEIPQQTNENDCGVFVLEYSRCLALSRPFQFSQKDIPNIRKRIYKELCDCELHELD